MLTLTILDHRADLSLVGGEEDPGVYVWRDPAGRPCAYGHSADGQHWMHWPRLASYRFDDHGSGVIAYRDGSAAASIIIDTFHRMVLPLALQRRGLEALHASGVVIGGRVVAFCAVAGTGKSTLAYGLSRLLGYHQWSDDAVVVDTRHEPITAVPLPFDVRLLPDAAEAGSRLSALGSRPEAGSRLSAFGFRPENGFRLSVLGSRPDNGSRLSAFGSRPEAGEPTSEPSVLSVPCSENVGEPDQTTFESRRVVASSRRRAQPSARAAFSCHGVPAGHDDSVVEERQATPSQSDHTPLGAVCVLARRGTDEDGGDVELRPLTGSRALAAVLEHAHCFNLTDAVRKKAMLEHYLDLVERVPIYEVRFRAGLDRLPAVVEGVALAFEAVGVRR